MAGAVTAGAARDRDDAGEDHWRGAGERIETLLDASSAGGVVARERAELLVREVVDLYGAGLRRILDTLDPATVEALTRDDLVASLLLVHGLHPHDLRTRVAGALDSVRPYLGSHGGDVTLLDVADGVVHLELAGNCRSCPSSSVTLELAVEEAVRAAAPEIESIDVVAARTDPGLIPADTLLARVHADPGAPHGGSWIATPELGELGPGEVGGFTVAGTAVIACRVGDSVFVYLDRCGACDRSLAGATLHSAAGAAILRCPLCHKRFDVVHAGAGLDGDAHLDPLPVLPRAGRLSVAVPAEVVG
ncbi:NifU family protein [Nocardia bovistercoris]|uniref:NifU family protein n=1 Tax=Nocardia bovistercoris TaxID=2785916 RepID=A0A931IG53_9NOCA|nr:NifU family protein [Nocardia bovistercoris]MBH0780824.1 NifU family protein [Nocardia bovistercoris]